MGTKRVGLARVEALMENLKRELSMGGSTKVGERKKVVLLTDAAAATANRSALTAAESGTTFLVPVLSVGNQTIALPAPTSDLVGSTYKFIAVGTLSRTFTLTTDAADTKILNAVPDGDGTVSVGADDNFGFTASADAGASFEITCISSTAAIAWHVSGITSGDATGAGEHAGS